MGDWNKISHKFHQKLLGGGLGIVQKTYNFHNTKDFRHGRPQHIRYLRISVGSVWLDKLIEDILVCN